MNNTFIIIIHGNVNTNIIVQHDSNPEAQKVIHANNLKWQRSAGLQDTNNTAWSYTDSSWQENELGTDIR